MYWFYFTANKSLTLIFVLINNVYRLKLNFASPYFAIKQVFTLLKQIIYNFVQYIFGKLTAVNYCLFTGFCNDAACFYTLARWIVLSFYSLTIRSVRLFHFTGVVFSRVWFLFSVFFYVRSLSIPKTMKAQKNMLRKKK